MNKKVFISMLSLCVCSLVVMYILKFFYPYDFVMRIENSQIVKVGNYIDSNMGVYFIFTLLMGIGSDYLYFGAICQTAKLDKKLWSVILFYNTALTIIYSAFPDFVVNNSNLMLALSHAYMLLTPLVFTKFAKPLAVTYTVNTVNQLMTLSIRNLQMLITTFNSLTIAILSIDYYLWAIVCFVIFNKKKEGQVNGNN